MSNQFRSVVGEIAVGTKTRAIAKATIIFAVISIAIAIRVWVPAIVTSKALRVCCS